MVGGRSEEYQIGRTASLNADHDQVGLLLCSDARRISRRGFPLDTIVSTLQYAATVSGTASFSR
jgi:hypothetical protein